MVNVLGTRRRFCFSLPLSFFLKLRNWTPAKLYLTNWTRLNIRTYQRWGLKRRSRCRRPRVSHVVAGLSSLTKWTWINPLWFKIPLAQKCPISIFFISPLPTLIPIYIFLNFSQSSPGNMRTYFSSKNSVCNKAISTVTWIDINILCCQCPVRLTTIVDSILDESIVCSDFFCAIH